MWEFPTMLAGKFNYPNADGLDMDISDPASGTPKDTSFYLYTYGGANIFLQIAVANCLGKIFRQKRVWYLRLTQWLYKMKSGMLLTSPILSKQYAASLTAKY